MSIDRKELPETDYKLDSFSEELIKDFKYARSIPLIHLANQFVNPGIPDDKIQIDSKKPAEKTRIDYENLAPDFTREQAFNRTIVRLYSVVPEHEKDRFIPWIEEIEKKSEETITEYELLILVLSYQHELGVKRDNNKSFNLLNNKKFSHNAYALYLLGECYSQGRGTEINRTKAFIYYAKATVFELGQAYLKIGYILQEGPIKDPKLTLENYLSGSEKNSAFALNNLGSLYFKMDPVNNLQKSMDCFSKSICLGTVIALNNYTLHIIEDKDPNKAYLFYKIAAEYSLTDSSTFNLANLLLNQLKSCKNSTQQAAFYLRVALLKTPKNDAVTLKKLEDHFHDHKQDYEITYHYSMTKNDLKTLLAELQNDTVTFNSLWCNDIDSKIPEIKEQALQRAIDMVLPDNPKIGTFPQRLRAHLAIHHFKKENEKGIQDGLRYIENMGLKELTAEENYQLGFWLHLISLIPLQTDGLSKHHLIDSEITEIEEDLFKSNHQNPILKQAMYFLQEATNKGHTDAKKLLTQSQKNKLIANPSSQGFFNKDSKDSKHIKDEKTSVNNSTASASLSLE